MAHFAELNEENKVLRVLVVGNENCLLDGVEDEATGIAFLHKLLGNTRKWKQTSYNGNFRKQYCGKGYSYDEVNNVFIAPKPYASWSLDASFDWQAPVVRPELAEGEMAIWNEAELKWDIVVRPV